MVLLAVVVTYLIVAAFETVGRWSNPALVRLPTPADFVARVPAAGLVALIIGLVMTSALSSRFCERGSRPPLRRCRHERARARCWRLRRWSPRRRPGAARRRSSGSGCGPTRRRSSSPRADGSYGGFLYDICRSAVAHAGVDPGTVELVPVDAGTRFERLDDAAEPLDLLCDPTTITMERAERWDFTPIVFFASSLSAARSRAVAVAGRRGAGRLQRRGRRRGWCWSAGSTARPRTRRWPRWRRRCRRRPARSRSARWPSPGTTTGCAPSAATTGRLSFYVGDADILSAQVDAVRREGPRCPVSFNTRAARPEPYALIVGDRIPGLHRRVSAGVYAFFRSGEAERSFAANFAGRQKSPMLESLFALYRLP